MPLPDADAHRGQAELGVAVVHGVDERRGDAGAAAPSGWPMAIAPPRTLTFASSSVEHADAGQRLGGERFVELDQVDVGEREAGALERFLRGRHGAGAHHAGSTPATAVARTFASGLRPSDFGSVLAHHQAARRRRR